MALTAYPKVARLDVRRAIEMADGDELSLLSEIADRKASIQPEMDRFAENCDRWDNLYYPNTILPHAGASHWAESKTAHTPGQAHVSLNVPPVYVDIPASLQSVPAIHNFIPVLESEMGRTLATMAERLYHAWIAETDFWLEAHKACVVKGLYGRTAAKVWWDEDKGQPVFRIVDQPRNLYLGWGTSDYTRLDWTLYTYRQSPEGVFADWGLRVETRQDKLGVTIPYVIPRTQAGLASTQPNRAWLGQMGLEVEVFDYWYRRPVEPKRRKRGEKYAPIEHETWNCIFVGNVLVKQSLHPEYKGKIPYVPLFNTYIPGLPDGRPELYDIESLLREKDERITAGAQMIERTINGQMWQLVGPEAPDDVPAQAIPKPNKVASPGPGNRLESVSPWMPEFQLEAYLTRLDRELADVSGLNDLLRGLAPAAVLSSSKAISALVANYEARIRMKRDLLYKWNRDVWALASDIWAYKAKPLAPLLTSGVSRLELVAPSLTPRDDMETANMAANLMNTKLWSQKRGMDKVGVDDPEAEVDIIKAERTDAAMFPADVQVMAQLMVMLQQLGLQAPPEAQQAAEQQSASLANYRQVTGVPQGSPMLNAEEEQGVPPPETAPENAPEGGPQLPPGGSVNAQTMVQEGEVSGRIVSNQPLQR